MENSSIAQMEGDKAMTMLDRQPHLLKIALMSKLSQEDEFNMERDSVPVIPYADGHMCLPSEGTFDPWRERELLQ